jgi:hypothetical protein
VLISAHLDTSFHRFSPILLRSAPLPHRHQRIIHERIVHGRPPGPTARPHGRGRSGTAEQVRQAARRDGDEDRHAGAYKWTAGEGAGGCEKEDTAGGGIADFRESRIARLSVLMNDRPFPIQLDSVQQVQGTGEAVDRQALTSVSQCRKAADPIDQAQHRDAFRPDSSAVVHGNRYSD